MPIVTRPPGATPFAPRGGKKTPSAYKVVRSAVKDGAEIYIYGPIGMSWYGDGVTASQFRKDLAALGAVKTIDVRINSEGGDVFDAQAIYTLLKQHAAKVAVHVDGLAASAASFIAMCGDTIEIAESAFFMIHNASGGCFGEAEAMRKTADLLDSVCATMAKQYADRSGMPIADVIALMDAETWMDGPTAVKNGFADTCVPNMAVAASVTDPGRYQHLPAGLRPNRERAEAALSRIAASMRPLATRR